MTSPAPAVRGGQRLPSIGSKKALDHLVDDDAKALFPVIEEQLAQLASDYMLSEKELDALVARAKRTIRQGFLRDMYAAKDRAGFVVAAFEPACEELTKARELVKPPTAEEVDAAVAQVIDDALDGAGDPVPAPSEPAAATV